MKLTDFYCYHIHKKIIKNCNIDKNDSFVKNTEYSFDSIISYKDVCKIYLNQDNWQYNSNSEFNIYLQYKNAKTAYIVTYTITHNKISLEIIKSSGLFFIENTKKLQYDISTEEQYLLTSIDLSINGISDLLSFDILELIKYAYCYEHNKKQYYLNILYNPSITNVDISCLLNKIIPTLVEDIV